MSSLINLLVEEIKKGTIKLEDIGDFGKIRSKVEEKLNQEMRG